MPHIQKYVQEQSSLDYTNASKSGDFWGSCYNMNGIIKYSFSQRKRENDLAPHWDDAAVPVWFLQTTVMTSSGCLSDPLLTTCLTLWPIPAKLCGKAELFKKWKLLQVWRGRGQGRPQRLPSAGETMLREPGSRAVSTCKPGGCSKYCCLPDSCSGERWGWCGGEQRALQFNTPEEHIQSWAGVTVVRVGMGKGSTS